MKIFVFLAFFATVVNAKCVLKFHAGCYRDVVKVFLAFRQSVLGPDEPHTLGQPRTTKAPSTLLSKSPGAAEVICRVRDYLNECLKLEAIPYHQRIVNSVSCYDELMIEVIIFPIVDGVFGGANFSGFMDPQSLWHALEPFCFQDKDNNCLADQWSSTFQQSIWPGHSTTPKSTVDLAPAECRRARLDRVLVLHEALRNCTRPFWTSRDLCHFLARVAKKLYWDTVYPQQECNLIHLRCDHCPTPTTFRESVVGFVREWSINDLREEPLLAKRSWCRLAEDIEVLRRWSPHCPLDAYESDEFSSFSRKLVSANQEKEEPVSLLPPLTLIGLYEIANASCTKKIHSSCLLEVRDEFATARSSKLAELLGSAPIAGDEVCSFIQRFLVDFTATLKDRCGRHTAQAGCQSLKADLSDLLYDWRFVTTSGRSCSINCYNANVEVTLLDEPVITSERRMAGASSVDLRVQKGDGRGTSSSDAVRVAAAWWSTVLLAVVAVVWASLSR